MQSLFRSALAEIVSATQADRAAILFSDDRSEPHPKVRSVHNLPQDGFWTVATVSTELLSQVRRTGEPLGLSNVPEDPNWGGRFSMAIASVRSLVCVPVWGGDDHPDGILYVDWAGSPPLGVTRCQEILQGVARKMEAFVRSLLTGEGRLENPFATPGQKRGVKARPVVALQNSGPTTPAYVSRSQRRFATPRAASQAVFFRSLSALFQAGLPLQQGLFVLAKQSEDTESKEICLELGRRLERGQSFSEALGSLEVFRPIVAALVRVAENSGTLQAVLEQISKMEERRLDHLRRLQVGLLYPALVALFALGFLVVVPGLLLSQLSGLLQELTPELPLMTKVLIRAASLLSQPLSWLASFASFGLLFRLRGQIAQRLRSGARRAPAFAPVFISLDLCQFIQALALQVQVGTPLQLALSSSTQVVSSDSPLYRAAPDMEKQLEAGCELHQILANSALFPPLVVGMVRVGEETGKLDYVLHRLVLFYEDDFLRRLETLTGLLEPLVICGLGTGVGLLLLTTMLPIVRAIEAL